MQFIQLLSGAVAYTIILLEVYSGAIQGPLWWVWPGGLVLSLLLAIQLYFAPGGAGLTDGQQNNLNPVLQILQWIALLALAFAASYVANYFGREMVPCSLLTSNEGWTAPAEIVQRCAE